MPVAVALGLGMASRRADGQTSQARGGPGREEVGGCGAEAGLPGLTSTLISRI